MEVLGMVNVMQMVIVLEFAVANDFVIGNTFFVKRDSQSLTNLAMQKPRLTSFL